MFAERKRFILKISFILQIWIFGHHFYILLFWGDCYLYGIDNNDWSLIRENTSHQSKACVKLLYVFTEYSCFLILNFWNLIWFILKIKNDFNCLDVNVWGILSGKPINLALSSFFCLSTITVPWKFVCPYLVSSSNSILPTTDQMFTPSSTKSG